MGDDSREIKEIKSKVNDLYSKIDRIEKLVDAMYREIGAREGRELSDQMNDLDKRSQEMKAEIDRIKIDTTQIRKTQEFGSRDVEDIKKALAAIYRNTDDLEKTLIPGERSTF